MDFGHLERKNRFRGRPSGGYKVKHERNKKAVELLKQYAQESTIHCVSHIFSENETFCHRMTWAFIVLLSASCAGYLAIISYFNDVNNPISITITDTQYPLERIWFPAVVLCPSNKIMLDKAAEYLSRHLKDPSVLNATLLMAFYKALAQLQHPLYIQTERYLKHCEELLPQLANVNLTALMYYSLPKCEDLFTYCSWQGKQTSCCRKLFSLQRTEEGFCYSFNSLTSESFNTSCKYFDAHNDNYNGCQLSIASSYGPSTGLQVFFKVLDHKKYPAIDFADGAKFKVQVFHPNDFPRQGIFNLIPLNGMNKLNIEIKPTITMSTERLKRFTLQQRGCEFKEEVHNTKIARSFSQGTCWVECRMAFMLHKCYCLPYYFNQLYNTTAPVCNSLQLRCIVKTSRDLRRSQPPRGFRTYVPGSEQELVCHHCRPTCNEVRYEVDFSPTTDLLLETERPGSFDGYIDVYYATPVAVMYTRDVTYDFIQILANLGGVGGLFLGASLLSIAEIIYWFSKAAIAFFWPSDKLEDKTINSRIRLNGTKQAFRFRGYHGGTVANKTKK